MNALIAIGLIGGDIKKHVAIALAVVVVVIALPVLAVFSLGSDAISFLSGSSSAVAAAEQGFYMGGLVPGDTYAWGNCTYWAYAMRYWAEKPIPTSWGNANTWDDNAIRDGYVVDHKPSPTAVMQTGAGNLGHVAYVTDVDPKTGEWKISEMNAPRFNVVSTETYAASSAVYYNFIHDKKVGTP